MVLLAQLKAWNSPKHKGPYLNERSGVVEKEKGRSAPFLVLVEAVLTTNVFFHDAFLFALPLFFTLIGALFEFALTTS